MDEVKADFVSANREKALTGYRHRASPFKPAPGENGPVKVWPALPRLQDRLRFIAAGYTQKEVAARMGIAANTVCQHFNGVITPRNELLKHYATEFGCPLEWLKGEFMQKEVAPPYHAGHRHSGSPHQQASRCCTCHQRLFHRGRAGGAYPQRREAESTARGGECNR